MLMGANFKLRRPVCPAIRKGIPTWSCCFADTFLMGLTAARCLLAVHSTSHGWGPAPPTWDRTPPRRRPNSSPVFLVLPVGSRHYQRSRYHTMLTVLCTQVAETLTRAAHTTIVLSASTHKACCEICSGHNYMCCEAHVSHIRQLAGSKQGVDATLA